ncbi:hypothetical protein TVAG_371820 [Trichomonas vaginalis G3]|uniref:Uncharacterized protein n=1 Tax=Trichomonas vaginalis (strain ATCC PRA-98 / G3) TaxID=412133 RepID=A2E0V3_TRIV3|nr:hypothetical protein TVAG_371820 [Trichomonas vaginalis G3]|eukprot:XP_001325931.1 hypothetical protein [Trichomonas vaginalis G3]
MKFTTLTTNDFITVIKQSRSSIKANELYICTRNANISVQNFEDIVSILKSLQKYMKLRILDGVINFLLQTHKEISASSEIIQNSQSEESFQNQPPKSDKEIELLNSQLSQINEENSNEREILAEISELKKSNDFERVYNLLDKLSSQGNQKMISKSCDEGLLEKKFQKSPDDDIEHVLHVATEKGNLALVKSLIEYGRDKDLMSSYGWTPLIYASSNGHLEVVKYLISVGADKEAKNKWGNTPLIYASRYNNLEVVKYLISVGADKEAKNKNGCSPLIFASKEGHLEFVKYLISVGANKETKNKSGNTPLIIASGNGHLEFVKYLISVGADKEARTNFGLTALSYAKKNVRKYRVSKGVFSTNLNTANRNKQVTYI